MADQHAIARIIHALDFHIHGAVDKLTIENGILSVTVASHRTFHHCRMPNLELIDDEIELLEYGEIKLEFTLTLPVQSPLNVSQLARNINHHIRLKMEAFEKLIYH